MKKSLKRKVISVVTALSMSGTMGATMASAANSFTNTQGYTYVEGKATVYTDVYGNTVYNGKGYILDSYGHRLSESSSYYLDYDGNAIITNQQHQHYDYGYDNYDQYGNYNNNYNPNAHVNVDILDPNVLQRYLQAHQANCQNPACIQNNHQNYLDNLYGYDNNYNYDYNNYPQYNDNNQFYDYGYENNQLYTLVKYKNNGEAIYAYSATDNVRQFGFEGWNVNSIYNENDYNLNSVFYEEAHTFGNNFYWNDNIMNRIMANSGLYVLKYQSYNGEKYCLSPIKNVPGFEYNSNFNPYNDLSDLKTAESVQYSNTRTYCR